MKALITASGQLGPFSSIEVLADRYHCDGADYPFNVIGAATVGEYVAPPHIVTASERSALIKQIDVDTDAIYLAVQGYRGPEYELAEADATAYKAAGYTGTVPGSVQSWATAKTQTAQWATDDILATASAWRGAQAQIRQTRLLCKETARTAQDLAPIAAQWAAFLVIIKATLGVG